MKLRILSDLHVEHFDCTLSAVDADAILLAGDIGSGLRGMHWAAAQFGAEIAAGVPVVYVPGNHEFYGSDMSEWTDSAKTLAAKKGLVFGDFASVLLEKEGERPVRVLAVTLWTDFAVFGEGRVEYCAKRTELALNDYNLITTGGRRLRWGDTKAIHEKAMTWLRAECAKANANGEKVVVVSHHGPSLHCSLPVYKDDPVTAGFVSNLEAFAAENVDVWQHGHVHNCVDLSLGRCRVVANPRGYPLQRWNPSTRFENQQFKPELVIEI
jgi:predicted phosphodiesterase